MLSSARRLLNPQADAAIMGTWRCVGREGQGDALLPCVYIVYIRTASRCFLLVWGGSMRTPRKPGAPEPTPSCREARHIGVLALQRNLGELGVDSVSKIVTAASGCSYPLSQGFTSDSPS